MSIKRYVLSAMLLTPVSQAHAQAPFTPTQIPVTIQGTVRSPEGTALAGARVAILPPQYFEGDQVYADTISDADGRFAFLTVPLQRGRYLVHASGLGFDSTDKEIEVRGEPLDLSIELSLKPPSKSRGLSSAYSVVRVYYATDRAEVMNKSSISYAGIRSNKGTLEFGTCDVSVPESHVSAEFERPSIWRLEFHADPEKHLVLQKVTPEAKDMFFKQVSAAVALSPSKDAFVFIHGYNVSFESAAIRTAQLAYDFGFKGAPILYSWPSKGSLLGYLADEDAIRETTTNFKMFLEDVANKTGASVVHVIAHSMGNRAAVTAISQLASDANFPQFAKLSTIVFAAPDVDRDLFISSMAAIAKPQTKISLYVSQHDQALIASHLLFHKQLRAGEGGGDSIVLRGLDTIDVSALSADAIGHSYYGDNHEVVSDVLEFLKGHSAPRPNLQRVIVGALAYWTMQPDQSASR